MIDEGLYREAVKDIEEAGETKKTIRPSKDEYYLKIAEVVSMRSTCLRRKYGVVIVKNDEIIATGYNGSARMATNCCDAGYCKRERSGECSHNDGNYQHCPAVHAEQNAMISASRSEMIGSVMYIYGYDMHDQKEIYNAEPCPVCKRMIANAGIKLVKARKW